MKLPTPLSPMRLNCRAPALRVCACLARAGVDPLAVLVRADLPPLLPSEPTAVVSSQQMILLLKEAQAVLQDEWFGLTGQALKPGASRFMFESALRGDTLGAMIDHAVRFMHFASPGLDIELTRTPDEACLRMCLREPERDPEHFLVENLVMHWHRTLSWAVGYLFPVHRLDVTWPEPPQPDRLCYLLCGDWTPGQPSLAMYFNARYLTLPVVRTPQDWQRHLLRGDSGQPDWPEPEQRWSLRLKALLRRGLEQRHAPPSLNAAAAELRVAPHTLRRHLGDEGTAYQQVLDQLRRDEAIEKLHVQHLSVAEVAEKLGYSEPRTFSRAFKQWTGVSPTRYLA